MQASKDGEAGRRCSALVRRRLFLRSANCATRVDVAYINNGEIGEITHKLYDTLTGIQWGTMPDELGWTVKVD